MYFPCIRVISSRVDSPVIFSFEEIIIRLIRLLNFQIIFRSTPTHSCCCVNETQYKFICLFKISSQLLICIILVEKFIKNHQDQCYSMPITSSRNRLKSLPCFGFVIKSPIISPVGQYFTSTLPFFC